MEWHGCPEAGGGISKPASLALQTANHRCQGGAPAGWTDAACAAQAPQRSPVTPAVGIMDRPCKCTAGAHLAGPGVVVPLLQVLVREELEAGIGQDAAAKDRGAGKGEGEAQCRVMAAARPGATERWWVQQQQKRNRASHQPISSSPPCKPLLTRTAKRPRRGTALARPRCAACSAGYCGWCGVAGLAPASAAGGRLPLQPAPAPCRCSRLS